MSQLSATHSTAGESRLPSKLRADCSRCQALCCVALPFDAEQGFGFDKPAHIACRHLKANHRCAIYGERAARGFRGCIRFDCYGAGQRVIEELLPRREWRRDASSAAKVFEIFTRVRALHEVLAMIELARDRIANHGVCARLAARAASLDASCSDRETLMSIDVLCARREVLQEIRAALRLDGVDGPSWVVREQTSVCALALCARGMS